MNKHLYRVIPCCILLLALLISGCERRPLEDASPATALVRVKIDWSQSGFSPVDRDGDGNEYVHRVSLRFFPGDGSPAFDRYLEKDINEGEIEVPVGRYSVSVFNESVYDTYWNGAVYFTDTDNYGKFAANLVADKPGNYPLYTPSQGETLVVEPLRLASWSLDDFEVTRDMVARTRSGKTTRALSQAEEHMMGALTRIVMKRLTYQVKVVAEVENLCSVQQMTGALKGFSGRVYMASGKTEQSSATHLFIFNSRNWNGEDKKDGTTVQTFLSFGCQPESARYELHLDVLLTSGDVYTPSTPLSFDVTDQVNASVNIDMNLDIPLKFPYVEGGINVGDWDDEHITIH